MKTIPAIVLLLTPAVAVHAANRSPFDGLTPKGLEAGAAAGSYTLSGLDTVNLYNRSLSLTVPLLRVGGRGDVGYTLSVPTVFKWEILSVDDPLDPGNALYYGRLRIPTTGYRPAEAKVRRIGEGSQPSQFCAGQQIFVSSLTRISIRFVDGSELELLDERYGGNAAAVNDAGGPAGHPCGEDNRYRTFRATDGSGTTFIADADVWDAPSPGTIVPDEGINGTLYFRDGRQYHFASAAIPGTSSGSAGIMDWMKDRNGNLMKFSWIRSTQAQYKAPEYAPVPPGCFVDSENPQTQDAIGIKILDPLGRLIEVLTACRGGQTVGGQTSNYCGVETTQSQEKIDLIRYLGNDGELRSVCVFYKPYREMLGSNQSGQIYSVPATYSELLNGWSGYGASGPIDDLAISQIRLADGNGYTFLYTEYGEPNQITLPTGGKIKYFWANALASGLTLADLSGNPPRSVAVLRRLTERWEYANGTSTVTRKTTYDTAFDTSNLNPLSVVNCGVNYACTKVKVRDEDLAAGNPKMGHDHYFYGDPYDAQLLFPGPTTYSPWFESREFQTDTLKIDGTTETVLRRKVDLWGAPGDGTGNAPKPLETTAYGKPVDPRVKRTDQINLESSNKTRQETTYPEPNAQGAYDNSNNPLVVTEWGFFTGANPTTVLRQTTTTYETGAAFVDPPVHLRSLATRITVTNGAATVSDTKFAHDQYDQEVGLLPLTTYSDIILNAYHAGKRGNITTYETWRDRNGVSSTAEWLVTKAAYDQAGNVVRVKNPRQQETAFTFGQVCYRAISSEVGYARSLITNIENALNQNTQYLDYDCDLGSAREIEDAALNSTYAEYDDVFGRLTKIRRPALNGSTASTSETNFTYDTALQYVQTDVDQLTTTDRVQKTQASIDKMGRPYEAKVWTGSSWLTTTTKYDGFGRVWQVSNPGTTGEWTTTAYDSLGRVASTTYPDASTETVKYWGERTLFEDAADKKRLQITDALGRLAQVVEGATTAENTTPICSMAEPFDTNLCTFYAYDALDNLTDVGQGGTTLATAPQKRKFFYNSLSQLVAAQNPEAKNAAGTAYDVACGAIGNVSTCYTYDGNGNLTEQKTSGVTTALTYDAIDRLTFKNYSDTTPDVTFAYDTVMEGCLSSVGNSVSTTSFTYAAGCQIRSSTQTTVGGAEPYTFQYGYNLAGAMTSELYPSGRTVITQYDAAGRPLQVCNTLCSGSDKYASNIQYPSYGLPGPMTFGNQVTETRGYNNRLQVTSIQTGPSGSLFKLINTYTSGSNNGNIASQTVNGTVRSYGYDSVNRLTSASQTGWSETYGYDAYGNRAVTARTGSLPPLDDETPDAVTDYNVSTNRIGAFTYDGRGNVLNMVTRSATYDGENHQVSVTQAGPGQPTHDYFYDGQGRRVKKVVGGATPTTTIFVYDAAGNLMAEYGGTNPNSGRQYLSVDHLGSTRLEMSATNTPHDYLPFGEEIGGACLSQAGGVRFTGQHRDQESCLDDFKARMMSSMQGRFTSPDLPLVAQRADAPQTWNLYAYVLNNPLQLVDPSGRQQMPSPQEICGADKECVEAANKVAFDITEGAVKAIPKNAIDIFNLFAGLVNFQLATQGLPPAAPLVPTIEYDNPTQQLAGDLTLLIPAATSVIARLGSKLPVTTASAGTRLMASEGAEPTFVFWSGPNSEAAANGWAAANNGKTIGMTSFGDAIKSGAMTEEAASEAFARAASGKVYVFSSDPLTNYKNIWYNYELPALAKNPKVTGIVFVDPTPRVPFR